MLITTAKYLVKHLILQMLCGTNTSNSTLEGYALLLKQVWDHSFINLSFVVLESEEQHQSGSPPLVKEHKFKDSLLFESVKTVHILL